MFCLHGRTNSRVSSLQKPTKQYLPSCYSGAWRLPYETRRRQRFYCKNFNTFWYGTSRSRDPGWHKEMAAWFIFFSRWIIYHTQSTSQNDRQSCVKEIKAAKPKLSHSFSNNVILNVLLGTTCRLYISEKLEVSATLKILDLYPMKPEQHGSVGNKLARKVALEAAMLRIGGALNMLKTPKLRVERRRRRNPRRAVLPPTEKSPNAKPIAKLASFCLFNLGEKMSLLLFFHWLFSLVCVFFLSLP